MAAFARVDVLTHQLADRVARLRDGRDLTPQGVASIGRKRREAVLAHAATQLHTQLLADGCEGLLCIERPLDGRKGKFSSSAVTTQRAGFIMSTL